MDNQFPLRDADLQRHSQPRLTKKQVLGLILRFEKDDSLTPQEAEQIVREVFTGSGFRVEPEKKVRTAESLSEVDLAFSVGLEGRQQKIGAEVKFTSRPLGEREVRQAAMARQGLFDRMLLLSRSGFSPRAQEEANRIGFELLDLLTPSDLRRWIEKNAYADADDRGTAELIIRRAMREAAELIARNAVELERVEWRDLERILREVFEGLGFGTVLTRSTKDGGFDLELTTTLNGERAVYLVEVKHWSDPHRPGRGILKDFVKIVVSREATRGLLLSSSGFTKNIYSGVSEIERQCVRLGGRSKIIGLCRTYYRLGTEIWLADDVLPQLLFEETS